MKLSKCNADASHLLAKGTNGEEIGDYYLVFYSAFAQAAQSVETLQNTE